MGLVKQIVKRKKKEKKVRIRQISVEHSYISHLFCLEYWPIFQYSTEKQYKPENVPLLRDSTKAYILVLAIGVMLFNATNGFCTCHI